jgi:hypothetical protein
MQSATTPVAGVEADGAALTAGVVEGAVAAVCVPHAAVVRPSVTNAQIAAVRSERGISLVTEESAEGLSDVPASPAPSAGRNVRGRAYS